MREPKKEFGYYGAAVGFVAVGLSVFNSIANGLESNFGTIWYILFVVLVSAAIVYLNKDKI